MCNVPLVKLTFLQFLSCWGGKGLFQLIFQSSLDFISFM